jgi:hypothetical protein
MVKIIVFYIVFFIIYIREMKTKHSELNNTRALRINSALYFIMTGILILFAFPEYLNTLEDLLKQQIIRNNFKVTILFYV